MKRQWFIGAILTACGAFAAATPWTIPQGTLSSQIVPQVAAVAGLPEGRAQHARFTLLPVPRLDIEGLVLRGKAGSIDIGVQRLQGRVRLLPLVGGRIELTELTLFAPRIAYRADAPAEEALRRIAGALAPGGNALNLPEVRRLTVVDGRVETVNGQPAPLSGVNLVAERVGDEGSYDLEGDLVWRGERIAVTSFGVDLAALLDGRPAAANARISGDIGSLEFNGRVTSGPLPGAEGRLAVRAPSFRRFAGWAGVAVPIAIDGALQVQGDLRLRGGDISIANARVVNAAGILEGALHLRDVQGRPALSGTLAGERLDLSEATRMLGSLRGTDGAWSRDLLDPALLPAGDVDLRLSSGRVTMGAATFNNVACALLSRSGRTDLTIGSAEFHKGTVKGRLSVNPAPRGFELRAQLSFDRVDTAAALATLTDGRRISGTGFGALHVEASGSSALALVRSLEGRANLFVRQGDIAGINLPEVLRRIEKRPLGGALDVRGGRTPFETANFAARISRGMLELHEANVLSPAARVALSGNIALAERLIAITGLAQLAEPQPGRDPVTLPFEVTGSFDDPMIVPDARTLMRRSGSTGPFFDLRARQSDPVAPLPVGNSAIAP